MGKRGENLTKDEATKNEGRESGKGSFPGEDGQGFQTIEGKQELEGGYNWTIWLRVCGAGGVTRRGESHRVTVLGRGGNTLVELAVAYQRKSVETIWRTDEGEADNVLTRRRS